jgi:hypothetical protein
MGPPYYVPESLYRMAKEAGHDVTNFRIIQRLPKTEPTPRQQARSDRMDRHLLSALGEPDHVGFITAFLDELRVQIRRATFSISDKKVGRPTETQSDVPNPFTPETNGNL